MQFLTEVTIIVAMFIVRLGVPIALMCLVSYALRRLDARWQAEARAQQLTASNASAPPIATVVPAAATPLIQEPCWEYRACPETVRARCPAYLSPHLPCWIARRQAEGQLPSQCCNCSLFTTARHMGMGAAA